MLPFDENIIRLTRENSDFLREVFTTDHSQLVLACLAPNEDLGDTTHWGSDTLVACVEGLGAVVEGAELTPLQRHGLVLVPAGTRHDIANVGRHPLRLCLMYAPPILPRGTIHPRKADALASLSA